eukprot:968840-Pyramimonas_sp.AAC.1
MCIRDSSDSPAAPHPSRLSVTPPRGVRRPERHAARCGCRSRSRGGVPPGEQHDAAADHVPPGASRSGRQQQWHPA